LDPHHCWHITIGDNVTIAPRVSIIVHDASTKYHLGYTRLGKVSINNNVFIGYGSTILPGVTIGNNTIIAAGSVVSHDVPPESVVAGNPAKVICSIEDYLDRKQTEISIGPIFSLDYTLPCGISETMKTYMNEQMVNRIGYVV
jgi:maltose O-acetyltransferase